MLLYVAGASCAGKTTALSLLRKARGDIEIHDFDEIGVPEGADRHWRMEANERWMQRLLARRRPVMLAGQSPFGEILSAPSAIEFDGIAGCLVDCDDWVRVQRLRRRGTPPATQAQLNWAAWHRVHARDPQWDRSPLLTQDDAFDWQRWARWNTGDLRWQFEIVDTSSKSPDDICTWLSAWTDRQLQLLAGGLLPLSGRWWD
ncbi:MAG: hypothetical protein J2P45_04495 [Candidatus Dormibacteraeota bacterium]|nr:hypothetical protein [Candidatus Dormibacteraeota bacterium]